MKRLLDLLAKTTLFALLGVGAAVIVIKFAVSREGVVVPELMGKDVVTALEVANKHGLSLRIGDRAFSASAPKDQVISQEPRPGGWLKREGVIRVVVSKGVGEAAVPTVRGLPWREAKAILERYGLRVGEVTRLHTDRLARDTVIAQSPPGEAKIPKGGTVTVLVSDGPPPVGYVMPDLRGQPQYMANEVMAAIGLRLEKVSYEDRPDARAGAVLDQRPAPGHRVLAGQGVELVLAKRETTPASKVGTFTVFQYWIPVGSGPRRIQIVVANEEESRQVFDEVREPGTEVRLLVKVKGDTVAKVYQDGVLVEERRLE
jgi:serine/threonine-protein kinase